MMPDHVHRVLTALILLLALAAVSAPAAAQDVEPGRLWLLRQYRVPGCEPMPSVPVVFNWLVRKALAIEEFIAASADCGQIGRRGAREGWTYIFWSERDDTAAARWVRRAEERHGVTRIVAMRRGEAFSIRGQGYEAFLLVQLGGDEGPARIWSAGEVAELKIAISVAGPEQIGLRIESATYDGRRCVGERVLRHGEPGGAPREAVPCQGG